MKNYAANITREKATQQRVTLDQAQLDYYLRPDTTHDNVQYTDVFTLSPDPLNTRFDIVQYWVKRERFDVPLSIGEGYVYILVNKGQPGILKIGYTDRTPQQRVAEINKGAGIITPWYISNAFPCKSPNYIESLVHKHFEQYNINKEGFAVTIAMAEKVISDIISENKAGI